jgi:hypothetical protein
MCGLKGAFVLIYALLQKIICSSIFLDANTGKSNSSPRTANQVAF